MAFKVKEWVRDDDDDGGLDLNGRRAVTYETRTVEGRKERRGAADVQTKGLLSGV